MVIRLGRHKHDFAKPCPTCRGHRHVIGDDEAAVVKRAVEVFGKAGKLYEGIRAEGHGPVRAYRMDCPACDGSGVQMYVPKNDLIFREDAK